VCVCVMCQELLHKILSLRLSSTATSTFRRIEASRIAATPRWDTTSFSLCGAPEKKKTRIKDSGRLKKISTRAKTLKNKTETKTFQSLHPERLNLWLVGLGGTRWG
jgi:hypothetical protein